MKRTLSVLLAAASLVMVSCSSYNGSGGSAPTTSGLKFRAFVSNPLRPTTGGTVPVLEIIDALTDTLSGAAVSLSGASAQPSLMAVSRNKNFTLVFSAVGNTVSVVSNATEAIATSGGNTLPSIPLPGPTESMFAWTDNTTVFAAVRGAVILGQPDNGAVEVINLGLGRISATIPVPNARYLVESHNGDRILVFGDGRDTVTILSPSLIGTTSDPRSYVCSDGTPQTDATLCDPSPVNKVFDHPVGAVFSSDDSLAYIFSCGAECNGNAAGVTVVDMSTNTAGVNIPLNAATVGLLQGNNLYVAGSHPLTPCLSGTTATSCGVLNVIDVGSLTVTATAEITDGYHTRMEMGSNGQLFIGAHTCQNINTSAEVRGCLSIFNTTTSEAVIPAANNDVTGLAPVPGRNVVYVVEDGEMFIYDTTTDQKQTRQVDIVGQAIDVKIVDF